MTLLSLNCSDFAFELSELPLCTGTRSLLTVFIVRLFFICISWYLFFLFVMVYIWDYFDDYCIDNCPLGEYKDCDFARRARAPVTAQ